MEEKIFNLQASIKIWNEFENLPNEDYTRIISQKVNLLLELMNSLSVDKVQLPPWKIWCEALIFKLTYHSSSILRLFQGTELPYEYQGKNILIFDEPSMIILFRSFLENYLTFFYLYGQNVDDKIKEFRNLIWRYSGTKQRTEFKITYAPAKEKQQKEIETLASLKKEILENPIFLSYKQKVQEIILEGRKPRLFKSWNDLIKDSELNELLFQNLYGYKSNYSHSEFISVLQIQMGGYGHKSNNVKSHHFMLLIHGIICKTILELNEYFPTMKVLYESRDSVFKSEVSSLANIISSKNPFLQQKNL